MQNDLLPVPLLPLTVFVKMVSDRDIPSSEADLDAAHSAAEALMRKARALRERS